MKEAASSLIFVSSRLPLFDAHMHPGTQKDWDERENRQILSLVCASTPPEAEALTARLKKQAGKFDATGPCFIPTFGLHPWHAGAYTVSEMSRYFSLCPVIGEIGMDSVWCDVPLTLQERIFREQLLWASQNGKPVILHTKGQEKAIARILPDYPNTYLVHWYSCEDYLEEYLRLGCYFSIGPDVWWNPAVRRTAELVPLNRLLLETDGMSAVTWAYEEAPSKMKKKTPSSAAEALTSSLLETAKIRHLTPEDAGLQLYHNFKYGFLRSCQELFPI